MDKIGDIRRGGGRGQTVASISGEAGVSEPTAGKYPGMGDLSPGRPKRGAPGGELLAPHVADIDAWLDGDLRNWRRQRHTATRAHARPGGGARPPGPHPAARRHAGPGRREVAEGRDRRDAQGFPGPGWLPGECQVDFGEADLGVRGAAAGGRCLTAAFPHPDVGLARVSWGETPGCVRRGPGSVSGSVGGVPRRTASGDAAEVGRRIGPEARVSEPFRSLSAHHGPGHAPADPHPGSEGAMPGTRWGRTGGTCPCPSPPSATRGRPTAGPRGRAWRPARAGRATGSAGPSPSPSEGTGTPSRRCRPRRSRASGGRPGGAAGRVPSPSGARAATPPAPPMRAGRLRSRSARSSSPPATARPARSSPRTGASGARPRRAARTPCRGRGCPACGRTAGGTPRRGPPLRMGSSPSWTGSPPAGPGPTPGSRAARAPRGAGGRPRGACSGRCGRPAPSTARPWPCRPRGPSRGMRARNATRRPASAPATARRGPGGRRGGCP